MNQATKDQLYLKGISQLTFSGLQADYNAWSTSIVASINLYDAFNSLDLTQTNRAFDQGRNRQFYNLLLTICKGYAVDIIKRTPDDGKTAWHNLVAQYAPISGPLIPRLFIDLLDLPFQNTLQYRSSFQNNISRLSAAGHVLPMPFQLQIVLRTLSTTSVKFEPYILKYMSLPNADISAIFDDLSSMDEFNSSSNTSSSSDTMALLSSKHAHYQNKSKSNASSINPTSSHSICTFCSLTNHNTDKCYLRLQTIKWLHDDPLSNRQALKHVIDFQSDTPISTNERKDIFKIM